MDWQTIIGERPLTVYSWRMISLAQKTTEFGFDLLGVVPAQPARRLDAYLRWVEQKMYGKMGYLARPDRIIRRQDLNVILPGVQTIICVGLNYFTRNLPPKIASDPSRGRISNYAWNVDYHDIMTPRLQAMADWLGAETNSHAKVYVDTGAILERDHAESAGFGFTGKNTMLIRPRQGSYFFLGEILTTAKIEDSRLEIAVESPISNPQPSPSCGRCQRCLDACPTNAFVSPYVLDARRCISYLTIELKGWIPKEQRPLLGNWIYGCDICQNVCPFNRFAEPTNEVAFYPVDSEQWAVDSNSSFNQESPALLDILALDEAGFATRFAHSPIKRIKRARLVRNACVAAGNWGSPTAVPLLSQLLHDSDPIIRGHAGWALGQIGGDGAVTAVTTALEHETDDLVRDELQDALKAIR